MEIRVINIEDDLVQIESSKGRLWGKWCSATPAEFKNYILELDSDDVIKPSSVTFIKNEIHKIENRENLVCLCGVVDDFEDDVLFLKIDKSIIMIQTSGEQSFERFVGRFVCITLSSINFYDTGLF
ncbi:MAG: hypothetical protein IJD37_02810 [Clostridia bacterium]|nr:hypothetical protein [Clostridia bacterium]